MPRSGFTHAQVDSGPLWQISPPHKLSDVAPVTANFNLTYSTDLNDTYSFSARVENAYVGQRYSLAFPYGYSLNGTYIPLPAYDLTNIRAGFNPPPTGAPRYSPTTCSTSTPSWKASSRKLSPAPPSTASSPTNP